MAKTWQKFDLEGGGLQTVNLQLRRTLRKRGTAYALWPFFALGLHRFYLKENKGAVVYIGLSSVMILSAWHADRPYFWGALTPLLIFALFDLWWIDGAVTRTNKALRMATLLRTDAKPPTGFSGRYSDARNTLDDYVNLKERERAGHPSRTSPPAANFARLEVHLSRENGVCPDNWVAVTGCVIVIRILFTGSEVTCVMGKEQEEHL